MITIEDKSSTGETISLDDKHFVNCKFERCTFLYSGGDVTLTNTTMTGPMMFTGPAQRTANLLAALGALKPGGHFSAVPGNPSPRLQ